MAEKGAAGAELPALSELAQAGEQGSLQPFLTKTYQLVDDPATDDVISWNDDGSSFVVWRPAELARDLLPEHFKDDSFASFASFVRQLNIYGFSKVALAPDRWEFGHDFFRRGEKPLLGDIHRQNVARPERSMEGPVCALVDAMFRLPAKLDRLLASYGHTLPRGAKDEIPLIKQDLEKMVTIVQVQEDSGAEDCSMMLKCLIKEVRELSYDMEDSVDQHVHAADFRRGILSPRRKKYKITRRRCKASTRLREKLKWRLWMANKIREFSMRSQDALQRYSLFNHLADNYISAAPIGGTSSRTTLTRDACFESWYPSPYGELVSIDGQVNKLQEWLGKDGEQKLKVVCVVGSGGIGKTTLAKELYRRISRLFDCRAFVRTSRKPDVRRLLISMLSQIRPHHTPHNWKVHSLIADIRTYLQDKRYLIVIDDVWATQTWDIINRALPAGNLCSGILVTTEVDDIALKCCDYDSNYVLTMKSLGQDDSSKLFFSTVFGPQYDCPPELSEVANNIIRKCAGLPLAIVTVASILANQMGKPEKWDYVNKSLGYDVSTHPSPEGMKQVLNLSYNNLPQHLKACVMYLSIYEEDYIIQKDDLVKQWTAEGLIRATQGKDMEEIPMICFDELITSRMIQPVHTNDNGDVLSCTVHHMVLDFIKHKSLEENFVTAIDHCQTTAWLADKVRRLSLQFGNAEATTPTNMTLSQVRTLAFFGVINCLPSILEFRLLQVLILDLWGDDERISFDLTGMSELFRLRYFHVTCNANLEVSQIQMRGLKYLETLNIDARVSAVPSDIVHLPGLLHLSVPVETNLPNGIGRMTSLCTLGYFDLSINSIDNVQSLGELTNLRYLRLTCSTVPSSHLQSKVDDMGSILAKLSNLRSVTLEPSSILGDGPSSMSISCDGLSSVSSPPALLQRFEWLPCICTFPSIPKWIGHLNKLCILKIGVRELASNDVDILRGLPALTVLSLYVRLKPSERIVFTKTGFSVLKVFKFRCSVPWLEFQVDAMPNLLKLKLGFDAHGVDQHCTIPAGIVHLIGLKEISAKIGVAGARDPDRRAAESGLIDAIKMHPACPTFNIQCLDGMFGGKDDNNSRVQEEEVEHMTLQKQYDIMEEDSIEQHVVLQKDTREDAGSRWEDSAPSSRPCGSIDDQSLGCKSGQSFLKLDSHDLLNYTAPCKMPKLKNLFDACKVSFSPDGPISDKALERVRALLDEIRPLDLGLDKEAKIARNWNSSTRQQKGRWARNGPNQYAPPIKYLHIHECESFSMGIFCMPPSSVTPLHNHPAMTVLSKLLYGKLHTESYDWIDVADPAAPLKRAARPARCLRDREVSAPETTILYPARGGNIHTFRAITPCALVDILSPPYSVENGRDCSYFRKSSVREPSVVLPSDIDSSEVVWLEELEDHQPPEGFVVSRGLYKGPGIKGDS